MDSQFRIEEVIYPEHLEKCFFMMVKLDPADGLDAALKKF